MEKVLDASTCFNNGGLHGCCIDGENIDRAKTGMGEMNGIIDMEEMTQLNHDGVGEPSMPFYY